MSYSTFLKGLVASESAKNRLAGGGSVITVRGTTNMTNANIIATTEQLINGFFVPSVSITVADKTLITPTAAQIVAAIPNCVVGSSFTFVVNNSQANNFNRIVTADTGVTVINGVVAQNTSKLFTAIVTNVNAGTESVTIH